MNGQRLRGRRQKKIELELRRGHKHTAELALRMASQEVNTEFLARALLPVSVFCF